MHCSPKEPLSKVFKQLREPYPVNRVVLERLRLAVLRKTRPFSETLSAHTGERPDARTLLSDFAELLPGALLLHGGHSASLAAQLHLDCSCRPVVHEQQLTLS